MRIVKRQLRAGVAGVTLAAIVALAPAARAQSGEGYLFGEPTGSLTLRGGFSQARANSDLFQEFTDNLTLKKSDFSGFSAGIEAAVRAGGHVDISADLGFMRTRSPSSYRHFVDNNNREIEQVTTLARVPLAVNAKLYLLPRGRSIGRFAWIPSGIVPWVGAGVGTMWYDLKQEGDFVDLSTSNVRNDAFDSSAWTPMAQWMLGVDFTLTPRMALTADARRLLVRSPTLGRDFIGYGPLDLSGGMLSLGLTVRL